MAGFQTSFYQPKRIFDIIFRLHPAGFNAICITLTAGVIRELMRTHTIFLRSTNRHMLATLAIISFIFAFQVRTEETITRHVPLMLSSNDTLNGFLKIINHSPIEGEVTIDALDDSGKRFGPITLDIRGRENLTVYASDLENGNDNISPGLGRGIGNWRLNLSSLLDIEAIAYVESSDGQLTSLVETVKGENGCWRIPTFNTAENWNTSQLRLSNESSEDANIEISGRNPLGVISANPIQLTLPAHAAYTLSAEELEGESDDFTGSIGEGYINWQLAIKSDKLINVMNLLKGDRFVTNLSGKPSYAIGHCWLGTSLANADRSIGNDIQNFVSPNPLTPAIYAAVIDETGVRAIASKGRKKYDASNEATVHDKLHITTATLPMTATMIATLVDDHSLVNGWNTSINDVFTSQIDDIHESFHDVTVRDLLTHQAGLDLDLPEWEEDGDADLPIVEQRLKASLATLAIEPKYDRGTFVYSRLGYMIAAAMTEQLTGDSWETLMAERLFEPLGMASAGFGQPSSPDSTTQPWGHTLGNDDRWIPTLEAKHVVLRPSGGVHVAMEDWAKFLQLWLNNKHPMLLNREKLNALITLAQPPAGEENDSCDYALIIGCFSAGWFVYPDLFGYGDTLNLLSTNGNWFSLVWIMPAHNTAYVVVANSALPKRIPWGDRGTYDQVLERAFSAIATSGRKISAAITPSQAK